MESQDSCHKLYDPPGPPLNCHLLDNFEDDVVDIPQQKAHRSPSSRMARLCIAGIMITLAIFSVIFLAFAQRTSFKASSYRQASSTGETCGATPSEARERGCVFDILSRCWIQPECFYPQIDREFRNRSTSPYYMDRSGSRVLTREQLPEYTGELFVLAEYHRKHCAFLLRRNHLAVKSEGKLPELMTSFEHTEHCTDVLMDNGPLDSNHIGSIFSLTFPACIDARKALRMEGREAGHSDNILIS